MSATTTVHPAVGAASAELAATVAAHAPDIAALRTAPTALGGLPAAQWLAQLVDQRAEQVVRSVGELDAAARRTASELRKAATDLVSSDEDNARSVVGASRDGVRSRPPNEL